LFAQIDPKGERTKEKKTTIPKVNGNESPNELNQKEEVINSNLDELAIRLSKFARSDPRKPGGYTAASFQRDQEILAEKQKAQALRMKQRELDIRAELNNIRRDQLTQNYFTTRLASLDKSIIDAMELFRDSPLYMNATNKIAILTQKLEEEQNKSGIFGFGGPDEEKIQDIKDDIKEQRDILKIGEAELTGGFIAEREALSNKYTELYTNYTGDDKKEDFNLKDQRTVGQ
jgi:small-conductance mechanosensitive channel